MGEVDISALKLGRGAAASDTHGAAGEVDMSTRWLLSFAMGDTHGAGEVPASHSSGVDTGLKGLET